VSKDHIGERVEGEITRRRLLEGSVRVGGAVTLGGAFAFGGLGCGPEDSETAKRPVVSSEPINKIFGPGGKQAGQGYVHHHGLTQAITGAGAAFGQIATRATNLAVEQIKAAGGPDIRPYVVDHKTGVVEAQVSGVRRIVSQHEISTLESSWLATTLATLPIAQENQILMLNAGGPSPQQFGKDLLWLPGIVYGLDPLGGILTWLAKNGAKDIVVAGDLPSGVVEFGEAAKQLWAKISPDGNVKSVEKFNSGLTDFSPIIARVKANKAEAVVTDSLGADLGNLIKQFREQGYEEPIIGVIFDSQSAEQAGKWIDSYHYATAFLDTSSTNPFTKQFVAAHKRAYGVEPEYYGGVYYEDIFLVWELIKRVIKNGGDPADGSQLQEALQEEPEFPSVFGGGPGQIGQLTFNPDHSANLEMGLFTVKNRKPVRLSGVQKSPPYLVA
jgi:branched-chain amino acid transport system substrate-binding protein